MTIVFSDSHCQPDRLSPQIAWVIARAVNEREPLVGVGDLFDLLPWGYDAFADCPAVKELVELLDGYLFDYVAGNHDPYRWVKRLFAPYGNIKVHRRFDSLGLHFRHGHGWSIDWWFLQHFASDFVEFMADYFPRPWYWCSRKMGWIPSMKKPARMEESTMYNEAIGVVWNNAVKYAQNHGVTVIVGHTHAAAKLETLYGGRRVVLADGGNLSEGTYLQIRGRHIRLCQVPHGEVRAG